VVGLMDRQPVMWRNGGDVADAFTINMVKNEFDSLVFLWHDGRLLLS
jgi:hypothetical protein